MPPTWQPLEDEVTQQHINQKAIRLKRMGRRYGYDYDDLRQHLALCVHRASVRYDARKQSWYVFLRMILSREANSLIRRWQSLKRSPQIQPILDAMPSNSVVDTDRGRHRGVTTTEQLQRYQIRLDVIKIVARLPYRLRQIADAIPDCSISELSRQLELDRSTIRSRLRQMRRLFEKHGLQDYLYIVSPVRHRNA